MKIYLFFLLLFIFKLSCAQNICAKYKVNVLYDENLLNSIDVIKQSLKTSMLTKNKIEFILEIDKNQSVFYKKTKLGEERYDVNENIVLALADYFGKVITYKNVVYRAHPQLDISILEIVDNKLGWNLTNEFKDIYGYLCYKATSTKTIVNSTGIYKHPITAWYCPKLPYKYGPIGYGNLPGMILELQMRNVVYGLASINLNCTNNIDNSFVNKMTLKTTKDIDEVYNKMD